MEKERGMDFIFEKKNRINEYPIIVVERKSGRSITKSISGKCNSYLEKYLFCILIFFYELTYNVISTS